MASYTHEYSDFPNRLYSVNNFLDLKDAPSSVVDTVTSIKEYIAKGNYSQASALLERSKDVLASYLIDARYINTLDEELRNLEIFTRSSKQALFYQNDEPDGVLGDVWLGN